MGVLTSHFTISQIRNERLDYEQKREVARTTMRALTSQIDAIVAMSSDMQVDSPEAKMLEQRKERLHQAEKALQQQIDRYNSQLEMLNQQEEEAKQERQESIRRSFAA